MPAPLIMVAPNGARRGKTDHPQLPVTLDDTVTEARACFRAGAQVLHLHVRDDAGRHTLDAGRYREALAALAENVPDMTVQITTESAGLFTPVEQRACLRDVRPDWASISVREIASDPAIAAELYRRCAEQGTRVQHIAYDRADLHQLADWRETGLVRAEQNEVICVLGAYAPQRHGTPEEIGDWREALSGLRFAVCAFGPQEEACLLAAGDVGAEILRVGFENNLTDPNGNLWTDNAAAVSSLRARLERRAA